MFLNFSHHPSATWSETQIQAAKDIGGDVEDLRFPDVPPELESVAHLASEASREILQRRPAAVLVQGESALTHAVVVNLKKVGVPCYTATTMRDAVETAPGVVERRFTFVRFRRY